MKRQNQIVRALLAALALTALTGASDSKDPDYSLKNFAIPQAGPQVTAQITTSCQPPQNQNITNLLGDILRAVQPGGKAADPGDMAMIMGPISMDKDCPPSSGAIKELPECSELDIDKFKALNRQAVLGLTCELKKGEALQGEMFCLNKALSDVNANLDQFRQSLAPLLNQAETDIDKLQSQTNDRKKQLAVVTERTQKMTRARDALRALVTGPAYGKALEARQGVRRSADQKKQYESMLKEYKMSLAMDCFKNRTVPGMACEKGGAEVTAIEGIKCYVQQGQLLNRDGTPRKNPSDGAKKRAARASDAIGKLLEELASDGPKRMTFPSLKELSEGSSAIGGGGQIKTPDDVLALYSDRLDNYGSVSGYSIKALVDQQIKYCYGVVDARVATERTTPGTNAYEAKQALIRQDELDSNNMKTQMESLNATYQTAMQDVTGMGSIRLNTQACLTASNADQASCLQAMTNAISTALTGRVTNTDKTPLTSVAMGVTGGKAPISAFEQLVPDRTSDLVNQDLSFKVRCSGLEACQAAMESTQRGLTAAVEKAAQQEKTYKTGVNKVVKDRYNAYKTGLAQLAQRINEQVARVGKAIGSIKAKNLMKNPETIAKEEVNPGESGMFSSNDLDKMMDNLKYKDGSFTEAEGEITTRMTDAQAELSDIKAVLAKADKKLASCEAESKKSAREDMLSLCETITQNCDHSGTSKAVKDIAAVLWWADVEVGEQGKKAGLQPDDKVLKKKFATIPASERKKYDKLAREQNSTLAGLSGSGPSICDEEQMKSCKMAYQSRFKEVTDKLYPSMSKKKKTTGGEESGDGN